MSHRPIPSHKRQMLQFAASKVPEVTVYFWITKILTTGMGETASDFLAKQLGPIAAVGLAGVALVASLALQLTTSRYVAWIYWTAVVMVSIFGTMAADFLHVVLGIAYLSSTITFTVVLAAVFSVWYGAERTLSIHSVRTRRREVFYWLTVMATFALGTATGDMTASTLHLGYLPSALGFVVLIALPALGARFLGLNAVFAFWFAYVVTRPLGASFADWMGAGTAHGGLGMGTGPATLVLLLAIAAFVAYLGLTRKDVAPQEIGPDAAHDVPYEERLPSPTPTR